MNRRAAIRMATTFLPLAGRHGAWAHPTGDKPATRMLGRTGREVTTFGLAGGNKVMWDLPGDEGVEIIVKAIRSGLTYLETANNYLSSQLNYGKAFRILNLIPGRPGYDGALRGRLFLASKSGFRSALIRDGSKPVGSSRGGGTTCIDDLKRSLTQFFGDGKGYIPEGAYLDLLQIHALSHEAEIDVINEGLDNPSDKALPRIGALAGLLDFRDGTNLTGLNPEHRKWIRHIGITGHENAAAHMAAIRRDRRNLIDTLLVALNPNDRHNFCHQTNSAPVAAAKGMGIIGMKIFADGVMYGLEKKYAFRPGQSVLSIGQPGKVSHQDFLQYTLSIPGVSTLITGIGMTEQLTANLAACQMEAPLDAARRRQIEQRVADLHGTDTNFFQRPAAGLLPPQNVRVQAGGRILWDTAYAAGDPLERYEIWRRDERIASIPFAPQITDEPFVYVDEKTPAGHAGGVYYRVRAVDGTGRTADSPGVKFFA
jgi:aryl-alcohol dehydrogenase-like predicted oxidoreductase